MEVFENDSRDNYSKVVLHKQLWIPLGQDTNVTMPDTASPDLTAWCARQEAERERIRKLEHTPVPPQRPPKKAYLRQTTKLLKSAEETLGLTPGILAEKRKLCLKTHSARPTCDGNVKSPAVTGDWTAEGKRLTSQLSLQIEIGAGSRQNLVSKHAKKRPPVPPKPVFEKHSGRYKSCNALLETSDQDNSYSQLPEGHKTEEDLENEDLEDNLDNNENDKENIKRRTLVRSNYWQKQGSDVINTNTDDSTETLENERNDIVLKSDTNNAAGEAIINIVSDGGNMSDVDKLKVHIKEVESITNLLIVLAERLDRIDEELKLLSANDTKDDLRTKKQKLLDQIEEANKLKHFRDRRGKIIKESLRKVLNADNLLTLQSFLENKVRLIGLLREVDCKISKLSISVNK